jgi:hypothetical protein
MGIWFNSGLGHRIFIELQKYARRIPRWAL